MNREKLEQALKTWSNANGVTCEFDDAEGVYELSWKPSDEHTSYIDVYAQPDRDGVVVVQHGTYNHATDNRQQGGVTRWRCNELPSNLTDLKKSVDLMSKVGGHQRRTLSYRPTIDIGRVHDFKLR